MRILQSAPSSPEPSTSPSPTLDHNHLISSCKPILVQHSTIARLTLVVSSTSPHTHRACPSSPHTHQPFFPQAALISTRLPRCLVSIKAEINPLTRSFLSPVSAFCAISRQSHDTDVWDSVTSSDEVADCSLSPPPQQNTSACRIKHGRSYICRNFVLKQKMVSRRQKLLIQRIFDPRRQLTLFHWLKMQSGNRKYLPNLR